jgi:hypothetical protein
MLRNVNVNQLRVFLMAKENFTEQQLHHETEMLTRKLPIARAALEKIAKGQWAPEILKIARDALNTLETLNALDWPLRAVNYGLVDGLRYAGDPLMVDRFDWRGFAGRARYAKMPNRFAATIPKEPNHCGHGFEDTCPAGHAETSHQEKKTSDTHKENWSNDAGSLDISRNRCNICHRVRDVIHDHAFVRDPHSFLVRVVGSFFGHFSSVISIHTGRNSGSA